MASVEVEQRAQFPLSEENQKFQKAILDFRADELLTNINCKM